MSQPSTERVHPYGRHANSREWSAIDRALVDLVDNRDLKETTAHEYIVGYLCEALATSKSESSTPPDDSGLSTSELDRKVAIVNRTREAILRAGSKGQNLVQELIDQRRQEAAHD